MLHARRNADERPRLDLQRPSYVRRLLPKLAAKAGIDKRVHPHGLRHTHASELAAERLPLGAISAQLGHASIATTSIYVAKLTASDLAEQMASIGRSFTASA